MDQNKLIAQKKQTTILQRGLVFLNTTSLDAPCVAVTWQLFFAHCFSVRLNWIEPVLLLIATWLAYSADRWFDSHRFPDDANLSHRHRVIRNASRISILLWGTVGVIGLVLAICFLPQSELKSGFLFLFVTAIYFLLHQVSPNRVRRIIPREIVVALFFTIATGLFVFLKIDQLSLIHWEAVAGYAVLCFLNALGIACWDAPIDCALNEVSLPILHPQTVRIYPWLCLLASVCAAVFWFWNRGLPHEDVYVCASLSSLLLARLHISSISTSVKPPLADSALLTPWIYLLP